MIKIEMPMCPSVNHYLGRTRFGGAYVKPKGREHKLAVKKIVDEMGSPSFGDKRLSVVMDVYPKDRRIRDLDNLAKLAMDSLTDSGVWNDDSQIDVLLIRRQAVLPKHGKIVLFIYEVGEVDILVNEKGETK